MLNVTEIEQIQPNLTESERQLSEFKKPITVQEVDDAEAAIVRCVQIQAFGKEMCVLRSVQKSKTHEKRKGERRKKTEIKRWSSIYRVSPFLHRDVLRVGGPLRHGDFTEQMKHPYILPRKSHVTTLLICHVHQKLGHAGRPHVLAALREKFWIICANAAVRQVLYQCVTCRRARSPPNVQKMADSPL